MCSRWSSAARRISSATASGAHAASASACASSQAKNSGSRISATLTASAMPAIVSRRPRLSRNRRSLRTANGGTNVPRKFFTPNALTPFFTPDARVGLGEHRGREPHRPDPAVRGRGGVPRGVEEGAAAHDDHEGLAVEPERVEDGLEGRQRGGVVLDRLPALDDPRGRHQLEPVRVALGVARNGRGQPGHASATARSTTTSIRWRRDGSFRARASTRSGFPGSNTSTVK